MKEKTMKAIVARENKPRLACPDKKAGGEISQGMVALCEGIANMHSAIEALEEKLFTILAKKESVAKDTDPMQDIRADTEMGARIAGASVSIEALVGRIADIATRIAL